MNTEYAIGKIRIPFASQARRRWFVGLFYAAEAVVCLAWCSFNNPKEAIDAWILSGCMFLLVGMLIIFTGIAGDMRSRGDEREMHRRDHAHYLAYRALTYVVLGAFLAGSFRGPNTLRTLNAAAVRVGMVQLAPSAAHGGLPALHQPAAGDPAVDRAGYGCESGGRRRNPVITPDH